MMFTDSIGGLGSGYVLGVFGITFGIVGIIKHILWFLDFKHMVFCLFGVIMFATWFRFPNKHVQFP